MCNAFKDGNLTGGMRKYNDHMLQSTSCFSYRKVPYDNRLCKHFVPAHMFYYLQFSLDYHWLSGLVVCSFSWRLFMSKDYTAFLMFG